MIMTFITLKYVYYIVTVKDGLLKQVRLKQSKCCSLLKVNTF